MGLNPSKNDLLNNSKFLSQNSKLFKKNSNTADSFENIVNVEFKWIYDAKEVFITGSFNNWEDKIKLEKYEDEYKCTIKLKKGMYFYKFIVDDEWKFSPDEPYLPDKNGNINNYIEVIDLEIQNEEKKKTFNYDEKMNKEIGNIIKELNFNNEIPELPFYYNNFQTLNKDKIFEDMLKNKNFADYIYLYDILNKGLVAPNNTDINNVSSHKDNYNSSKEIKVFSTVVRYNNKYSTMKLYFKN